MLLRQSVAATVHVDILRTHQCWMRVNQNITCERLQVLLLTGFMTNIQAAAAQQTKLKRTLVQPVYPPHLALPFLSESRSVALHHAMLASVPDDSIMCGAADADWWLGCCRDWHVFR